MYLLSKETSSSRTSYLEENRITVESAIANEVQSEYDEDEEEGGTIYNENNFKFVDFSKRLPHPKIVRACGLALKHFDTNTVNTNHCIIKLLHRIAFDCKMYVMIFQLGIFRTFQKLFKTKDSPQHKELVKFATYIVRQFIKVSETNKKVFMEALFWKSSKECYDIEHGYMEAEDRSSAAVRAWSEEQEDEVRRLFMEHQQTDNNEDVVDFVTNNLIDQTKTRRQVLKKLKELMLLVNYKKKSGTRGSRAPKNWTPQEEITLQELFEQYRESDDPLGNIMDNLDIPRSKNRIVEKLLIMGLIQDKKEVRKKRARKGERSHPHNSDNDIVNSSSSDSDDDSISSQRSASSNVAAPTQRRPKKAVSAKIKKPAEKKKPVKRLPVSKSRIAEMIIKVVDLEMHDALEWLKESLSDAIEDYEVENNEGIPLVPIMDYAETAMENPEFQRMLKSLGVSPPFDEQEVYWRIPVHLPLDTLKNYSDMIQQALDKTLQIQEESHSTQASTPAVLQDRDSSDDEDVFGKLRKMTKSDSPDRVNRQLQNDKVTLTAINENSSDSVDQDIAASSNGMKGTSSNRKKSRLLAESDEDSVVDAQENEDTALVEDIIKENVPLGGNISSGSTSSKKKKFRIIPESDEESEDENSKAISSEQGNQVEETSFSSKTRDFLESDSEEETEKAGSEAKRIRSVSDSESEKPAAKRVRILDSDDDDD